MEFLEDVLPRLAAALAGVYFYFYFRRIAELAGLRTELREVRIVLAALAAVFVIPAMDIWGFWAVVVLYLASFALLTDLVDYVLRRAGRSGRTWRFLHQSGILPVLALAAVLTYGWWNMHHIARINYTVYADGGIRENGYRIGLISDLHYGMTMDAQQLAACCEAVSRERPDVVVLCGDLVDEYTTKRGMQEAFQILAGIRTKYGIYYIYGNHDRGRYSETPHFTEGELHTAVRDAGIRILKDEAVTIQEELTLIGRDDRTNPEYKKRASSESLAAQTDPEQFRILLDHQPRELKKNAEIGYDLQLSGHTHGGQIWPVGMISDLLGFGEMNYGQRRIGEFEVIVTSGMAGWNYPFRTGKRSEYVIVDILPGQKRKGEER